jgi:hypothetical protein
MNQTKKGQQHEANVNLHYRGHLLVANGSLLTVQKIFSMFVKEVDAEIEQAEKVKQAKDLQESLNAAAAGQKAKEAAKANGGYYSTGKLHMYGSPTPTTPPTLKDYAPNLFSLDSESPF